MWNVGSDRGDHFLLLERADSKLPLGGTIPVWLCLERGARKRWWQEVEILSASIPCNDGGGTV